MTKKTSGKQDHLRGLSTVGHCRPCASCLRWPSSSLFLVILLRSAQTHLPQDPPATPSVGFPTAYTFSLPPCNFKYLQQFSLKHHICSIFFFISLRAGAMPATLTTLPDLQWMQHIVGTQISVEGRGEGVHNDCLSTTTRTAFRRDVESF